MPADQLSRHCSFATGSGRVKLLCMTSVVRGGEKSDWARGWQANLPAVSRAGFELGFDRAITIIVGENGTSKSTLLEGIAALAGYDDAGSGKGYRPVDHTSAMEATGGRLARALRASWLPRITNGWFFRAESFFSVARHLDKATAESGGAPPDFLSHSPARDFFVSSKSAADAKASLSSTSRNPRCRRYGRSRS
jgi:predicted ATPase